MCACWECRPAPEDVLVVGELEMLKQFRNGPAWGWLAILCALFLVACGPEAWERDPQVQAAKKACQGLDEGQRYDCIERHAVESLNPDVCRLAGIWIDDMCLQAVYEAAGDPAICEQLYLEGVRPTCRAYYQRPPADWTVDTVLSVAGEPGHQTIAAQIVVTHQGNRPIEDLSVWLVFPRAEGLEAEAELTSAESASPGPLEPNHARTFTAEISWQTGLAKAEINAILDHVQIRLAWTADRLHLVYSVDGHQDQSGIWLTGLDGGEARRLFAWNEGERAAVKGPWFEPGGGLGR